jgi:hypothetical protein
VAHTCNPSFAGGRDQEGRSSKPARQIVCNTLSQKYPSQKGLAERLKMKAISSSPSTTKKEKKNQVSVTEQFSLSKENPTLLKAVKYCILLCFICM